MWLNKTKHVAFRAKINVNLHGFINKSAFCADSVTLSYEREWFDVCE